MSPNTGNSKMLPIFPEVNIKPKFPCDQNARQSNNHFFSANISDILFSDTLKSDACVAVDI